MADSRSRSLANTDMRAVVGTHDILWVTLDTLRFDVAIENVRAATSEELEAGRPLQE